MEHDSPGKNPRAKLGQNPGEDIFSTSVEIFVVLADQAQEKAVFTAKVHKVSEAQFALDGHGAHQFFHVIGVTVA